VPVIEIGVAMAEEPAKTAAPRRESNDAFMFFFLSLETAACNEQ
jgi:hypothetical protein